MVIIEDKLPRFKQSLYSVLNDAFREAARDGLIKAKDRAPFDKGGLRSDSEVKSIAPLYWRITFWKEYARFQELGGDSKRRVRRYSTSGTGKGFLKKSGDEQAAKLILTIRKHTGRARV